MKSLRRLKGGYTITEVMIVLVVSSSIFIVAVAGYSRQNSRTQFSQAVRDVELRLQDVLNDVSTGYYPNNNSFTCIRNPSGRPQINPGAPTQQGRNQACIFVGRAVDFTNNSSEYSVYTIVDLRDSSGIAAGTNRLITNNDLRETSTLHGSINIRRVIQDGTSTESDGFAVISGYGGGAVGGAGATTNQVAIVPIAAPYDFTNPNSTVVNSPTHTPITLCIEEAGGGPGARRATVTIGAGNSQVNVVSTIDQGWPVGCN